MTINYINYKHIDKIWFLSKWSEKKQNIGAIISFRKMISSLKLEKLTIQHSHCTYPVIFFDTNKIFVAIVDRLSSLLEMAGWRSHSVFVEDEVPHLGPEKLAGIGEESCCWVGENKEDARCDLEAIANT